MQLVSKRVLKWLCWAGLSLSGNDWGDLGSEEIDDSISDELSLLVSIDEVVAVLWSSLLSIARAGSLALELLPLLDDLWHVHGSVHNHGNSIEGIS